MLWIAANACFLIPQIHRDVEEQFVDRIKPSNIVDGQISKDEKPDFSGKLLHFLVCRMALAAMGLPPLTLRLVDVQRSTVVRVCFRNLYTGGGFGLFTLVPSLKGLSESYELVWIRRAFGYGLWELNGYLEGFFREISKCRLDYVTPNSCLPKRIPKLSPPLVLSTII